MSNGREVIGLYKTLESGEEVLADTGDFVSVCTDEFDTSIELNDIGRIPESKTFVKSILALQDEERKEIKPNRPEEWWKRLLAEDKPERIEEANPSPARVFLTNKYLRFLTFQERLRGSWFSIPLKEIREITGGQIAIVESGILLSSEEDITFEGFFVKTLTENDNPRITYVSVPDFSLWVPEIESRIRPHIKKRKKEAEKERRKREKLKQKREEERLERLTCEVCGTTYESEKEVKIVECPECGRRVCREEYRKTGLISKEWVKTDCFDEEQFKCKICA